MQLKKDNWMHNVVVVVIIVMILTQQNVMYAQTNDKPKGNPVRGGGQGLGSPELITQSLFQHFDNITETNKDQILEVLGFCIEDVKVEWRGAFDFSKNTSFMADCIMEMKGDVMQRMCTAAEMKFYGIGLLEKSMDQSRSPNYITPNKNCNISSWVPGCEPGWACSAGSDKVDLQNADDMPKRILNCQPCCEGFFCPRGLTCMIPCPLGAYCPVSTLNKATGVCDPYLYQLPPGQTNHTCGGADVWADFLSGRKTFCESGYYCPTTTQKLPCSRGHYCRSGSTSQTMCYNLAICEAKAGQQIITIYGILFFGGIMLLLIIIYNWSDQALSSREKKQAQSREAAAKIVKESVQESSKWKSSMSFARLSRTFTRKKTVKQQDQPKSGLDTGLPPMPTGSDAKGKRKEASNLTKMMQDIEENPNSHEGFNLEIGDKNLQKQTVNTKNLHTQSQIFRYAFGQIEKEKAFQEKTKNMTYSGAISMASEIGLRKRPPIEVFFKDLTLTLRGKDKHILRCVTGKLSPGRVSAVMGPSGAGKTTFLSALTGRAMGCTASGLILINGKDDPMQSYKKIIGFVPQDDVVHGNLTVEENIWFSARCRLPAETPMADKVLVVERVIESLGLQRVRDSLVGTVEKRGISGGQKKRVNVGLEMVMEPSLLILDEPTSGLDSSSSQLLLRALRHEALEGVNVCMVIHQPSYTLFNMFDDLILLAKGGLIAYLGPVKKVEEYFSGLGINVPERVNPPDHYIDVLEGIVKPKDLNFKDLPVKWMLHNGYPVPPDMMSSMSGTASDRENSAHLPPTPSSIVGISFAGDVWKDVVFKFQQKKENIRHNYLRRKDLSNRETPGIFRQYRYFLGRVGKQRLRDARVQTIDFLILLLAGVLIGIIAGFNDETFGYAGYLQTVIAVSLLSKIGALRSFSYDKLYYWRESSSGMSTLAYFMSKDTIDLFNVIVKPAVYLSMFYFFNSPRSTITDNYMILICLVYCVTGIAYVFAVYFQPGPAQLFSVMLPVILTLFAIKTDNPTLRTFGEFCFPKWAIEAFLIANAKTYSGVWLISRCGLLAQRHFHIQDWYPCLFCLVATGIFSRVAAYICLVTFQKK